MDITKIFWVVLKNLKMVSKSWSSMGVLIIGPLALILILGFSFANATLHDINIGLYNEDVDEKLILGEIDYGRIIRYKSLDDCNKGIIEDNLDVCLHMSNEFKTAGSSKINIVFYYDNSKKISTYIINELKSKITQSSKKITRDAVDVAADNFQSVYDFFSASKDQIDDYIEDAETSVDNLRNAKENIKRVETVIDSTYNSLYNLENELSDIEDGSTTYDIERALDSTELQILAIDNNIAGAISNARYLIMILPQENNTEIIQSLRDLDNDLTTLQGRLDELREDIQILKNTLNFHKSAIGELRTSVVSLRNNLATSKNFLNDVYNFIDSAIYEMNNMIDGMKKLKTDLDTLMGKMDGQSTENMKGLADPITTDFRPLLENFTNVYFLFPTILIMIIVFVSMLLSNIITLNEMHSPAYLRNFTIPVSSYVFETGVFISSGLISLFQISVLLVFSQYNLGIPVFSNITEILPLIILVIAVFNVIGMNIAYLIRHEQTSILVSTIISIGAFIFSNSLLPLKVMPKIAADIASYNPIVISSELLRRTLFLDTNMFATPGYFYTISGFIIAGILLLPISKYLDKRRIG